VTFTVSTVEEPACKEFGLAEPVAVGLVGVGVGVAVGVAVGVGVGVVIGVGVGVDDVSGIASIEMLSTARACALAPEVPEETE
jgi:hypothetical protein